MEYAVSSYCIANGHQHITHSQLALNRHAPSGVLSAHNDITYMYLVSKMLSCFPVYHPPPLIPLVCVLLRPEATE